MIPSASISKHVPADEVMHFVNQKKQETKKRRAERNDSLNIKCALCGNQIFGDDLRVGPYNVYIHPSAARMLSRWCKTSPEIRAKLIETQTSIEKSKETTAKYAEAARIKFLELEKDFLKQKGKVANKTLKNGNHCGSSTMTELKRVRAHSTRPVLIVPKPSQPVLIAPKPSFPAWEPEITQEMIEEARKYREKQVQFVAGIAVTHSLTPSNTAPKTNPAEVSGLNLLASLISQLPAADFSEPK
jgi:hypothetical protein